MTTVLPGHGRCPVRIAAAAALVVIGFTASALAATLTPEGLAKVRFGMTVRQAQKALGAKLVGEGASSSEPCWYARRSDSADPGVFYMVEKGRITRIDVEQPTPGEVAKVTTARGIGLGASLEEVKRAYGALKPETADSNPGTTIFHVEAGKGRGTVIEIRDGKVTSFHSGLEPALDYSEGCS
jgi:hypothetical protein